MDRSEGERGWRDAAETSPSRREAARREQAQRDKKKRIAAASRQSVTKKNC